MTGKKVLITGGAGFIGSNLAERLLSDIRIEKVRVLDDLSTGFYKNIEPFLQDNKFEFFEGDIRSFEVCQEAVKGMDLVSHQAALGSVPRSINDPISTNAVNITGTLNIFKAAVDEKIPRIVFAASSSTYGDNKDFPKKEENIGKPLSPYAVTKLVNELYADVFNKNYGIEYIGLRYFNIFGPKQDPGGAYAAVIPLFFKHAIQNTRPTINGDGSFSRDFTYIDNAVNANLLALFSKTGQNKIYNIACGHRTSLNELWEEIKNITGSYAEPIHGKERKGDVPHSMADISKAENHLKYKVEINSKEGLRKTFHYYKNLFNLEV